MTIYQFLAADEMEQIEAFGEGVYIGERIDDGHITTCHQVDGFYVEYKKHIEWGVLREMRVFKNPVLLKPYLDQMDKPNIE